MFYTDFIKTTQTFGKLLAFYLYSNSCVESNTIIVRMNKVLAIFYILFNIALSHGQFFDEVRLKASKK